MAKRSIDPNSLPSNNRDSPNTPPPKQVASGREKKRSLSNDIRNIVNDLFLSVVVPSTRDMVYQFLNGGLQQMIYNRGERSEYVRGVGNYRPYHLMSRGSELRARSPRAYVERSRSLPVDDPLYQTIFFDDKREAEMVLALMLERLAVTGWVTLGDMRHMARLPTNVTHQRYGWNDLTGADVVPTSDGYIITLPDLIHTR